MPAQSNAHRFRFYDSTVDSLGNQAPLWSSYKVLTINPISYDGYGEKDINEVDTLYEARGTLVEESYFDHRPRKMEWEKMAKFKYFDEDHGSIIQGGSYPQFMELAFMEYHRSGKFYFLDDRGYTTAVNPLDFSKPKQVYIQIRVDRLSIDGFATVPKPYFNKVSLEYTPIAVYIP